MKKFTTLFFRLTIIYRFCGDFNVTEYEKKKILNLWYLLFLYGLINFWYVGSNVERIHED